MRKNEVMRHLCAMWWCAVLLYFVGCQPANMSIDAPSDGGIGGSPANQELPTVHMPFPAGTAWRCTQGAGGSYSHSGNSTREDVDFDTPNPPSLPARVFAPVSGRLWYHAASTGFGCHASIAWDGELFVVLGHLLASSCAGGGGGEWVEAGDQIGEAGCTGYCNGDHVHLGVHRGDASVSANGTPSVPFAVYAADTQSWDGAHAYSTRDLVCGLSGGHFYESQLATPIMVDEGDDPPEEETASDDDTTPPADDDSTPVGDDDSSPPSNTSGDTYEGDEAGECNDGADNDADGAFDCADSQCAGAPVCAQGDDDDDSTPPAASGDDDDSSPPPSNPPQNNPPAGPTAHELCWVASGLANARAGELWVWAGGWQTIASASGTFAQLCGTVYGESGSTLTVNGEFTADNVPGTPWWLCANTGAWGMQVYGSLWLDGLSLAPSWVGNGVGGCDATVQVP